LYTIIGIFIDHPVVVGRERNRNNEAHIVCVTKSLYCIE